LRKYGRLSASQLMATPKAQPRIAMATIIVNDYTYYLKYRRGYGLRTMTKDEKSLPAVSFRAEGVAISSIRRGRMNPYVASLAYAREKPVYVMLSEAKHLVLRTGEFSWPGTRFFASCGRSE
jgi:hypothetical protein